MCDERGSEGMRGGGGGELNYLWFLRGSFIAFSFCCDGSGVKQNFENKS